MSLVGIIKLYRKALSLFHRLTVIDLDCFAIGRFALHYMGPWPLPEEKPGKLTKAWRTFLTHNSFWHAIYNTTLGFPMMAYVNIGIDFPVTIESLATVFISVLGTSIQYGIVCRRHQLERIMLAMEATRKCSMKMPLHPKSISNRNRLQSTILARLLIVVFVVSPSVLLTLPKAIQKRMLVNNVWYPFDVFSYPIYPVVLLVTTLAHVVSITILGVHMILMVAMLAEVAGHFRLLSYNLRNLRANHKENNQLRKLKRAREKLKMCVQYHHSIIRFVDEIRSTYNADLFIVGLSVVVPNGLGVALVAFSEEMDSKMVTFVIVIIFGNIIVLGLFWAAQDVIDESEDVRQAVYDGDWFGQSESFKKSMRIIMSRCNQPVVIEGGGLMKFSMEAYYDSLKLTYSYSMALWTSLTTKS